MSADTPADGGGDGDVLDTVERYVLVSAIRCSECGELHETTLDLDGETVTADDLGIESKQQWEAEMEAKEGWMRDNLDAVRKVLPRLEKEWPITVMAIRHSVLPRRGVGGERR